MREKILTPGIKGKCAVFLDRDGTMIEAVHLLHKPEQMKLIKGAAEAIRILNDAGIPVIVITNQPVVARGLCTEADVEETHKKMLGELAEQGARLDAIYWCPHSKLADVPEYRKDCPYRKPAPGMIKAAAERFGFDLKECFMVGDSTRDIKAGENAGCRTVLVETGAAGKDAREDRGEPDYRCKDLLAAAKLIVKECPGT